jgi:hypothetical protein
MSDETDINPDRRNVISRRIVEVTDHDDTIFAEFIELEDFEAGRLQWA